MANVAAAGSAALSCGGPCVHVGDQPFPKGGYHETQSDDVRGIHPNVRAMHAERGRTGTRPAIGDGWKHGLDQR